jgi:signal transduction histidine kinase
MQIRERLTCQYVANVAAILLLSSLAIYFFSSLHREKEFYSRLKDKAASTARLLIEAHEVDTFILKTIDRKNLGSLFAEKVVIYNHKGEVIYTTDESNTLQLSGDLINQVQEEGEVRLSRGEYEVAGIPYSDGSNRYVVFAAAYDKFGVSKLRYLRIILFTVFIGSTLFVLVSGWVYSGRALAPISKVVKGVNAISARNLNARVDEGNGKDEIAQLARTFNQMLERLETAFRVQKMFVSNASHELRNPLTVICSQLEVALMKERPAHEYRITMTSVLDDMQQLTGVLNRLISLAQVSADERRLALTEVRVDELLWECMDELIKRFPAYRVKMNMEGLPEEESLLYVQADEALLKIAFLNLMENACKYSAEGEVLVELQVENGSLHILFIDKGIGIAPEELPQIFNPFYRSPKVTAIRGQGIGLSLVERIAGLHSATISVDSVVNKGTTVHVRFPASVGRAEILNPSV